MNGRVAAIAGVCAVAAAAGVGFFLFPAPP